VSSIVSRLGDDTHGEDFLLKILGGCREARHRAFRFNPREARGISTAIPAAGAGSIMNFCWRIVPEAGDDA